MMAKSSSIILIAVLFVVVPQALATSASTELKVNPIRKVVNLLQAMQEKVAKETKMADKLFEKFQCYCQSSGGNLAKDIDKAESKVSELGPDIKAAESKKEQAEEDLASNKNDRSNAEKTMSEDTAIRKKEHHDFEDEHAEEKVDIKAVDATMHQVEDGTAASSLLQSKTTGLLRSYLSKRKQGLSPDRQELLAFLSNQQGSGYEPQSGQIMGTLAEIKNEMVEDDKDMIHDEEEAEHKFEGRMDSKKKEVGALSKSVENKLDRVGTLGVEIASMKGDLEDSSGSLAEDKAFLKDLENNCKAKAATHEQEKKMRAQEMVALADTIKILNDDDALELFKKTLPGASASLLQLQTTASSMRARAKQLLAHARSRIRPGQSAQRLDFISLALHGDKVSMKQVIDLIDKLIATLKKEQRSDNNKKDYCAEQFDQSESKQVNLKRSLKDSSVAIEETKEGLATLGDEVVALKASIVELDKAVAEATEQRKEENAEYKELMTNNAAAKELLLMAQKRLAKFYQPKASQEGSAAPSFVQLATAHPPPPETMAAYTKKSEESGGVLQMISVLINDLEVEMTEAKTEEKMAQQEYEQTMTDSADKRAADSKSLSDKEGSKAELQTVLETSTAEKKSAGNGLVALASFVQSLHAECDWLVQYYDVRKQARADELDALEKAKGVLSGSDYSLLQQGVEARTRKFLPLQKNV